MPIDDQVHMAFSCKHFIIILCAALSMFPSMNWSPALAKLVHCQAFNPVAVLQEVRQTLMGLFLDVFSSCRLFDRGGLSRRLPPVCSHNLTCHNLALQLATSSFSLRHLQPHIISPSTSLQNRPTSILWILSTQNHVFPPNRLATARRRQSSACPLHRHPITGTARFPPSSHAHHIFSEAPRHTSSTSSTFNLYQ